MARYSTHFINAVNTANQTLIAGGNLVFTQVVAEGNCIGFATGTGTFTLPCKGVYAVYVSADVVPSATGPVIVSIVNNGTVVPGSIATNQMTEAENTHVALQGVIPVLKSCECVNNTAQVQVIISAAATVDNANIIIEKIA